MDSISFEVVIVGGSYSGLSAAMTLGRSFRKVLVIDSGTPCNRFAPHSHNFLTQDGEEPSVIREKAKAQVLAYPSVQFETGKVTSVTKGANDIFSIETEDSKRYTARSVLFATGLLDKLPAIKGFKETWGISTLHCPYCHGYEKKGVKTLILANGKAAVDFSIIIRQWSENLTLVPNGKLALPEDQAEVVRKLNLPFIEKEIEEISHVDGIVNKVIFKDGTSETCECIYARPDFEPQCSIPKQLGCKHNDMGFLEVDQFGRTSVPGVYASGDTTTPFRKVSLAVGSGTMAGTFLNIDLIKKDLPK